MFVLVLVVDSTDGFNIAIQFGTAIDHSAAAENICVVIIGNCRDNSILIGLDGSEALNGVGILRGGGDSGTDSDFYKTGYTDAFSQIGSTILNGNIKRHLFAKGQIAADTESLAGSGGTGIGRNLQRSAFFKESITANTDSGAEVCSTVVYSNGFWLRTRRLHRCRKVLP